MQEAVAIEPYNWQRDSFVHRTYDQLLRLASPRAAELHRARKKGKRKKEFIQNYLSSHPCVDCGLSDVRCLEFDHINGDKSFSLSDCRSHSQVKIEAEIAKCEVRCANCHRIRHAVERLKNK